MPSPWWNVCTIRAFYIIHENVKLSWRSFQLTSVELNLASMQRRAQKANRTCDAVAIIQPKEPPTPLFHKMMFVVRSLCTLFRSTDPQLTVKWHTDERAASPERIYFLFIHFFIFAVAFFHYFLIPSQNSVKCGIWEPKRKWKKKHIFTISSVVMTQPTRK